MSIEKNNSNFHNVEFEEEISIKSLIIKFRTWILLLKSKWKVVFILSFLGMTIGTAIAWNEKPIYKAVLTFAMEEDKSSGIGGAIGLASSIGLDLGGSGGGVFATNNLSELMKSRLIIEKTLLTPIIIDNRKTNLAEYYIHFKKLRQTWLKNSKLKDLNFFPKNNPEKFSFLQDSIFKVIHKSLIQDNVLTISQKDKKATIIYLEFKSENENFAKYFCEYLAKETSELYIETKSKKAKSNVFVLQKQVDSIRTELNTSIFGLAKEIDNVYNLNPALNIQGANSKKKQIDVQANSTILTNLVVQLELAKITLRKETPLIQMIDQPKKPLDKNKFGKLNAALLGFSLGFLFSILFIIIQETKNNLTF